MAPFGTLGMDGQERSRANNALVWHTVGISSLRTWAASSRRSRKWSRHRRHGTVRVT